MVKVEISISAYEAEAIVRWLKAQEFGSSYKFSDWEAVKHVLRRIVPTEVVNAEKAL